MNNEQNEQVVTPEEEVVETVEQTEETTEQEASEQVENEVDEKDVLIQQLQAQIEENKNRMLRLQADFDNYRRRAILDREAADKYRAQSLVTDLLPIVDNFERALQVEITDEAGRSLLSGMEMVFRQLTDALAREGVEAIEAVGVQFDPNLHQAVMTVENSELESNEVVMELQKGYKLKDRVIRPSMVQVNQ
ncbi:MAG: nucleotide exchange factor GrpE [Bacillaceae bacterium]